MLAILGITIENSDWTATSNRRTVYAHCYAYQKATKTYVDEVMEVPQLMEMAAKTGRLAYDEMPCFNGGTGKKVSFAEKVKNHSFYNTLSRILAPLSIKQFYFSDDRETM